MSYSHTQTAPLGVLVGVIGAAIAAGGWFSRAEPVAATVLTGSGVAMIVLAVAFHRLTVRDEGDALAVRFGPLPLFRRRIAYGRIRHAERGRSRVIDGWGIHWLPGRGTTFNLWGFDCVELDVDGRTIRIGSDDPDGLVSHVRDRTNGHG